MDILPHYIKYIGVDDDNLDLFEGQYPLTQGISYNSYIVEGEKIAIIDTADKRRRDQWLSNLEKELSGRCPDYIVVQHMEPDHSASLAALLERYPETVVTGTATALRMVADFFPGLDISGRSLTVNDGDILDLGGRELRFITAPMVHWPEVMISYEAASGTLFSADAFGTFALYSGQNGWPDEARRYYCNIVGRYGRQVQSLLAKLSATEIKIIAPLHGPVLSGDISCYTSLYDHWSRYEAEQDGVLVAYASIYGGTADAAHRVANMLRENGVGEVVEIDLCRHHLSHAVAEAFRLSSMVLCSVTYDASIFPPMQHFLEHLRAKNLRGRRVAIIENGSWAPIAGKLMTAMVEAMPGMETVCEPLTIHSRLRDSDLPALQALAEAIQPR